MLGFIYRDFAVVKSYFLKVIFMFYIPFSVVLWLSTFCIHIMENKETEGEVAYIGMSFLIYFLFFLLISWGISESFLGSDHALWKCFTVATPGGMKDQIRAKYVVILISNIVLASACMITDAVNVMLAGSTNVSAASLLVGLLCWNFFKEATTMPFVYVYGAEQGRKVKLILLLVMLLIAAIYGLYGDISMFLSENFWESMLEFISSDKVIWIMAVVPYVTLGLFYLSYRITLLVYPRGLEQEAVGGTSQPLIN